MCHNQKNNERPFCASSIFVNFFVRIYNFHKINIFTKHREEIFYVLCKFEHYLANQFLAR